MSYNGRIRRLSCCLLAILACALQSAYAQEREASRSAPWAEHVQLVLDETKPLAHDLGGRLPLYLWPAMDPGPLTDQQAELLVGLLAERGVGLVCSWRHDDVERSLAECLRVAHAQQKRGLLVNVNATSLMYRFFDGSAETAHVDANGKPFFDETFGKQPMGCPFRLEQRVVPMRQRMEAFTEAYAKEEIELGFVFADWEIDGPLEWNRAHEASKRCLVCREQLPRLDDFLTYQQRLRSIRSRLQHEVYAEPVLRHAPSALVGNYAVYPHDGWRYWYDYFERYVEGQPALHDQHARYRHWANDFESSGYTFAMPVVYPWSWTWNWYDFEPGDYRWFYNGLLVASNAGRYTPASVPIIAFVHWHTVDVGESCRQDRSGEPLEAAKQMSEGTYRELLWHMLLRGTDTFFLWCQRKEQAQEVRLLHPVWAAAQEYGTYLAHGAPINYDVPRQPGPVVSGLRLGDTVLVRRTDFTDEAGDVRLRVANQDLTVPRCPGRCQILRLR